MKTSRKLAIVDDRTRKLSKIYKPELAAKLVENKRKVEKNSKRIKNIDKVKKITGLAAAEKAGRSLYQFVTGKK